MSTAIPLSTGRAGGGYRIGIDTGGTFTDVVVGDATGILSVGKALTTRERISQGILEGLAVAAAPLKLEVGALLRQTAVFIYGSTRATNAILEGKTARTAFWLPTASPTRWFDARAVRPIPGIIPRTTRNPTCRGV